MTSSALAVRNEHLVVTFSAPETRTLKTQRIFQSAVQTLVVNWIKPFIARVTRKPVDTIIAQRIDKLSTGFADLVFTEKRFCASFTWKCNTCNYQNGQGGES